MDLCENRTTDTGKAVVGSSLGSADSVQQNLPSALSQPQGINPLPCSTTRTSGSLKSGVKRKVDDENETMSETSHPSKRVQCGWLRAHYACHQVDDSNRIRRDLPAPSISSSSNCSSPSFVGRMADEDDSGNHQLSNRKIERVRKNSAAPSTSSSSRCLTRSAKRKMADCDASDNQLLTDHKIKRVRKNSAAPPIGSEQRPL